MKTALWFSRHAPTPDQIKEIDSMGYSLIIMEDVAAFGRATIENDNDLRMLATDLAWIIHRINAWAVFGVFPAPLMELIQTGEWFSFALTLRQSDWPVLWYSAWNVQRSEEGGKPTFCHKRFCLVGEVEPREGMRLNPKDEINSIIADACRQIDDATDPLDEEQLRMFLHGLSSYLIAELAALAMVCPERRE